MSELIVLAFHSPPSMAVVAVSRVLNLAIVVTRHRSMALEHLAVVVGGLDISWLLVTLKLRVVRVLAWEGTLDSSLMDLGRLLGEVMSVIVEVVKLRCGVSETCKMTSFLVLTQVSFLLIKSLVVMVIVLLLERVGGDLGNEVIQAMLLLSLHVVPVPLAVVLAAHDWFLVVQWHGLTDAWLLRDCWL